MNTKRVLTALLGLFIASSFFVIWPMIIPYINWTWLNIDAKIWHVGLFFAVAIMLDVFIFFIRLAPFNKNRASLPELIVMTFLLYFSLAYLLAVCHGNII